MRQFFCDPMSDDVLYGLPSLSIVVLEAFCHLLVPYPTVLRHESLARILSTSSSSVITQKVFCCWQFNFLCWLEYLRTSQLFVLFHSCWTLVRLDLDCVNKLRDTFFHWQQKMILQSQSPGPKLFALFHLDWRLSRSARISQFCLTQIWQEHACLKRRSSPSFAVRTKSPSVPTIYCQEKAWWQNWIQDSVYSRLQ